MKKLLALLLALTMVIAMVACGGNTSSGAATSTDTKTTELKKVALITDVGTIDDESFNQATWQGVEAYCKENNVPYNYYQPTTDSTDARLLSIDQAIAEGANVVVMPGFLFGAAIISAQAQYPDVKFVAIDVSKGDLTLDYKTFTEPASNTTCITFAEEQAGYLAGYAAVKDGYTKLGFLGGMAVPAVVRYGYGYVQGADAAAKEMNVPIEIKYTYGGQFKADAAITAKMEGWYTSGTKIVFACGGGIYDSAVEAATKNDGMVIGVDVDQHYIGEKGKASGAYTYNPFLTSAMKALQGSTETVLKAIADGNWSQYSGQAINLSLAQGDYVGLPTADASWCFKTFTKDEYQKILEGIKSGSIKIDNDSTKKLTDLTLSANTTVTEVK